MAHTAFYEHRRANKQGDLFFRFWTTALPARERPAGPLTFTPGIMLWEKLRSGDAPSSPKKDTAALLRFLKRARKPQGFSQRTWALFTSFLTQPGQNFPDFIRRFEWATGAPASEGVAAQVHDLILARNPRLTRKDAELKYDQLFGYVIRLLARAPRQGTRTLTLKDFEKQIAKRTPDTAVMKFVSEFRETRDLLSRQLSTISSDVTEVKENTRAILAKLGEEECGPTLERVIDPDAVLDCFGAVSRSLISWPQETKGQWIERPELQELRTLVDAEPPRVAVLLGEPGSGKSALLARLAAEFRETGTTLLALKIDRLPTTVRSLHELDQEWFPNCGLLDGVRAIAQNSRVIVLIDQMDALASLIDQQSSRLEVVIEAIRALRSVSNVGILLSCREFDFKYDSRFNRVEAQQIHLTDPPWEKIDPILRHAGIDAAQWPAESREVLRRPQHLSLFVSLLVSSGIAGPFGSYEAMLEAVFTERVIKPFGVTAVKTCEAIAGAMAETGDIWLPILQFDTQHGANIERLTAAGILRKDGRVIGFQHQTMFDYVRVRAFCSGAESLAAYVLGHQGALFVRPTLWAAASSWRSLARSLYQKEVGKLWRDPALRKHLRFLLISFLGHVTDPDDAETQWLLPAIDTPLRDKVLVAVIGSPGWFAKLRSRFPLLLGSDDPQELWELSMILRSALEFDRNNALDLIRLYWHDSNRDGFVLNVFRDVKNWDPPSIGIVKSIVDRCKPDPFYIKQACESMASAYPELAADLLVTRLNAELAEAGSVESVLLSNEWYGIDDLATLASWPLLDRLWAWLRDALGRSPKRVSQNIVEYRREDHWQLEDELGHPGLMQLFTKLLDQCAGNDPERFKGLLEVESASDSMLLHRLLFYGLRRVAPLAPEVVLDYLTGDPRRLSLGSRFSTIASGCSGPHSETKALISAVLPHMGNSGAVELERYIMGWHYYQDFSQGDPEYRLARRRDDRRHRLQLLGAFPVERLSPAGQRLRREKGIALPKARFGESDDKFGLIGSPMSTESMEKASKESILRLFVELPDGTGHTHPRDWTRGGAIQAAQAFGKLAEKQPQKVIEIVREFKASQQELPAAEAINGLSKVADVAPKIVIDLIHELDRVGFRGSDFRQRVSWALSDLSGRAKGLPDETCALLECWIEPVRRNSVHPPASDAFGSGGLFTHTKKAKEKKRRERPMSILWGHSMLGIYAHGNYPIIRAFTYGLLNRDKPGTERWVAFLEKHVTRRDSPDVWTSLLLDLRNLRMVADTTRAAAFARDLMRRQPSAFRSVEGLMFLAWNHRFLPADVSRQCLRIWRARNWKGRDQAIGEFSLLRSVQVADDRICCNVVRDALSAKSNASRPRDLRVGIAYAAINLWSVPSLKQPCHDAILQLIPLANDELAGVLMDIFRVGHPMPPDRFTVELLSRVIAEPKMLACHSTLAHRLNGLLADGLDPVLVGRTANAILDVSGQAVGDLRSRWAADSRYLVQIAMTLQRIAVSRDSGLDLFERLMDLGAYEIDTVLREVDRKIM